jgi:hypothetical protein
MPWTIDTDKIICIVKKGEKHEVTEIPYKNPPKNCAKCPHQCFFWRDREGYLTIRFNPEG